MRDGHLQSIAERGRMAWHKVSSHNWRVLVEVDISRFKRVIGDGLRSRSDRRRVTEVAIAMNALNQMLELGRPEYVRIISCSQSTISGEFMQSRRTTLIVQTFPAPFIARRKHSTIPLQLDRFPMKNSCPAAR